MALGCVVVFELGCERARLATSHTSTTMGPPQDRDVAMGPPPPRLPSTQPPPKDNPDVLEKYRKLKRRYFELEEVGRAPTCRSVDAQRTSSETPGDPGRAEALWGAKRPTPRGARVRPHTCSLTCRSVESSLILQRIHELETRSEPSTPGLSFPPSSAFPRSLLSKRSRDAFVSNLRLAMAEDDAEDHNLDPLLASRYLGPLARKRPDEEPREHIEDDARHPRRQTKRSRATAKGKEPAVPLSSQPILALAPVPQHPEDTPPLLVSHKGARLRLKPPVKPPTESDAGSSANHRPPSPLSPVMTPPEDRPYQSASYAANGAQPSVSAPPPANSPPPLHVASPAASASRPSDIQRHAKPKRLKAHTVTSKSFSIPTVPRDKKGRPLLPLNVGIMTVVNLGEVCMREHFHTERYIFPVGYEVTRCADLAVAAARSTDPTI